MRNLHSFQIHPHPEINFIVGPNGSGKTSLLEGIALLSRGRSFRTVQIRKVITSDCPDVTAFGVVEGNDAVSHRLGIRRTAGGDILVKVDGEKCDRLSDLALRFPTLEIESSSFEIVDGGPSVRRDLLDWGLFHVEHQFHAIWKRYRAALEQKSALLKTRNLPLIRKSLSHWNQILAGAGQQLDEIRQAYSVSLQSCLAEVAAQYLSLSEVSIHYHCGWNADHYQDLGSCLEANADKEIERERCLYGPHKADLEILWEGEPARDRCSRGQKKLVLYAVRLAQVLQFHKSKGFAPVLLLDDLPAELDRENLQRVARFLVDYPCQSFITAIDKDVQQSGLLSLFGNYRVFHVEHGQLIHTS